MSTRTIFFGTPEAAVPSLEALIASDHEVVCVVTAPDRPRGRGMLVEPSPVKRRAQQAGLSILQPATLRSGDVVDSLRTFDAGVVVVVAYGLILPPEVLNVPALGCLNVHFSLLPRLRGAAPVQWALIEGHDETGVTIIQMDERMDTGPIYGQSAEPINPSDDAGGLEERLAQRGAGLLLATLDAIEREDPIPTPQDDSAATYAPKITSELAHIDWSVPAESIRNRVRAFSPRPGAWTTWKSKRLKVFKLEATDQPSQAAPGTLHPSKERLLVSTTGPAAELVEVQPEGKGRMSGAEFVRGYRPTPEERLL